MGNLRLEYQFNHKAIRERREFLRLTQKEAAELANMYEYTWRHIEKGIVPKIRVLCDIAAALSCEPGLFFVEIKHNG